MAHRAGRGFPVRSGVKSAAYEQLRVSGLNLLSHWSPYWVLEGCSAYYWTSILHVLLYLILTIIQCDPITCISQMRKIEAYRSCSLSKFIKLWNDRPRFKLIWGQNPYSNNHTGIMCIALNICKAEHCSKGLLFIVNYLFRPSFIWVFIFFLLIWLSFMYINHVFYMLQILFQLPFNFIWSGLSQIIACYTVNWFFFCGYYPGVVIICILF